MTKDERNRLFTDNTDLREEFPEVGEWDVKACVLLDDLITKVEELIEVTKASKA